MHYHHLDLEQNKIPLPVGKIVCIGRNYIEHAKELHNPVPDCPLLFMKPSTALTPFSKPISAQTLGYCVHYELEIAVLIGEVLKNASKSQVVPAIAGIGLALDLTLRDLQNELKAEGYPWEKAKGFDNSCPISPFYVQKDIHLNQLNLQLSINDEVRQQGQTQNMMVDIISLIQYVSSHFTLLPGDTLLTGTPAGVGALSPQDKLTASLDSLITVKTSVI